jgi:polysaccharide pyruvyl transferase WcaK-like protein
MYAHRLHANIAAYSYGIPQVGFSWDTKLKSFLSQVGRGECLATVGVDPVEQTLQLGKRQLQTGVDRDKHLRVLRQAQADVADLARAVTGLRAVQAGGARSGSA